jgi:hypothetical protein
MHKVLIRICVASLRLSRTWLPSLPLPVMYIFGLLVCRQRHLLHHLDRLAAPTEDRLKIDRH